MNIKYEIEKYIGKQIEELPPQLPIWKAWYSGFDEKFHRYNVHTGAGQVLSVERFSLGMAKASGESWANLLMNEKTFITIDNEKEQEQLNYLLGKLNFNVKTNQAIELSYCLGDGIGIVGLKGLVSDDNGVIKDTSNCEVTYEFIEASRVYPISWIYGELIEVAVASFGTYEGDIIIHKLDERKEYDIIDLKYRKTGLHTEFELESTQIFKTKSKRPLFGYLKPNIANNKDINYQRGISIYANAIDCLKSIDINFDCYNTELQLSRSRAFYKGELEVINPNGDVVEAFDPNDILIYKLPKDDNGESSIRIESGQLRTEQYSKSLNDALSLFGYKVGLGKDYFSFGSSLGRPVQTATGIIAQNMELYRSMMKNEIVLRKYVKDVVFAMIYMTNKFCGGNYSVTSPDEIKVLFDDSIFEDKESGKESDRKDVNLGIMSEIEYRMDNYGESEEVAKQYLMNNPVYIGKVISSLLPALQNKVLPPEQFVLLVYGQPNPQMQKYIEDNLATSNGDDLMSLMFDKA